MKLESLKSSKFEAFKENELKNLLSVVGGKTANTTYTDTGSGHHGTDSFDYANPDGTQKVILHDLGGGDLTYNSDTGHGEADQNMVDRWIIEFQS